MTQDLSFLNNSQINIKEKHATFRNSIEENRDDDENTINSEEDRTTNDLNFEQIELEHIGNQSIHDQDNQDGSTTYEQHEKEDDIQALRRS